MKSISILIAFSFGNESSPIRFSKHDRFLVRLYLEPLNMYSKLQLTKKYIQYHITGSNKKGHGIHSPFVFDFIRNVLNDRGEYDSYQMVESVRTHLLKDHTVLDVEDFGAGSGVTKSRQKKVRDIARYAAKPKKFGQLLFRIVQHYHPRTTIELGTSLGLTTSYLALAYYDGTVHTLEGAPNVASIAKKHFQQLNLKNIGVTEGNFDDTLPGVLESISNIDLAFLDGNHRKEPTLRYFNQLLKKINASSIVIFDDIHWSTDMEDAWETIKANPDVKLSIDLFFMGLVFFRDEFKTKQHFTIRF